MCSVKLLISITTKIVILIVFHTFISMWRIIYLLYYAHACWSSNTVLYYVQKPFVFQRASLIENDAIWFRAFQMGLEYCYNVTYYYYTKCIRVYASLYYIVGIICRYAIHFWKKYSSLSIEYFISKVTYILTPLYYNIIYIWQYLYTVEKIRSQRSRAVCSKENVVSTFFDDSAYI